MSTATTTLYAEIVKAERNDDGDLVVVGKATGPELDLDGQVCDSAWLAKAMPEWMSSAGNLREQHSSIAAGVATELSQDGDSWMVAGLIVDPVCARKVEKGVLKGYSIGIKNPRVVRDANAPGGRITAGTVVEVSLVDRPCNPTCTLTLAKSATVDSDVKLVKVEELREELSIPTPKDLAERLSKAASSISSAQDLAARLGKAASDEDSPEPAVDPIEKLGGRITLNEAREEAGVEPVYTTTTTGTEELTKAIADGLRRYQLPPQNPTVAALKKAIQSPGEWKPTLTKDAADGTTWTHDPAELRSVLSGLVDCMKAELDELVAGDNELWDLTQLLSSISGFCCWWSSEAAGGETESPYTEDGSMAELAATPDTTKTVEADVETPTETPEAPVEKTVEPEETKTAEADKTPEPSSEEHLAELVKSAVADATKSLTTAAEEREAALAKELDAVRADLQKVLALPEPGGPVITRTAAQAAVAREHDSMEMHAAVAELRKKADAATDPTLRRGYKERADAIMLKIA